MLGSYVGSIVYFIIGFIYGSKRIGFLCGDIACKYDGQINIWDILLIPATVLQELLLRLNNSIETCNILETGERLCSGSNILLTTLAHSGLFGIIVTLVVGFLLGWIIHLTIRKLT